MLSSAAAVSANNIWAIGSYADNNYHMHTLTQHWNGSAWTIVSSPNPNSSYSMLNGVVALSATNIWAVGSYLNSNNYDTLIEHYC